MQTTRYQYVSIALAVTLPFRDEEKACMCGSFFQMGMLPVLLSVAPIAPHREVALVLTLVDEVLYSCKRA